MDEFNIDPHTLSAIWYGLDGYEVADVKFKKTLKKIGGVNMDAVAANNIIKMELLGLFPKDRLEEMKEIINYYKQYEGEELDWIKTTTDYVATEKKTNYIKKLIDEEVRFMLSKPLYFNIDVEDNEEAEKKLNKYLKRTLKKNLFNNDIIKATKNFLMGKRIALKLVANKETKK